MKKFFPIVNEQGLAEKPKKFSFMTKGAVDCGRAAYAAAGNIAKRISHMTRAEILTLDEILDYPELLKYWNYLTGEDIDAIIAFMKENAEQDS